MASLYKGFLVPQFSFCLHFFSPSNSSSQQAIIRTTLSYSIQTAVDTLITKIFMNLLILGALTMPILSSSISGRGEGVAPADQGISSAGDSSGFPLDTQKVRDCLARHASISYILTVPLWVEMQRRVQ
jgi:hypothetical protein